MVVQSMSCFALEYFVRETKNNRNARTKDFFKCNIDHKNLWRYYVRVAKINLI